MDNENALTAAAPVKIREVITLRKFDGDPPAEGEHKDPVETIELVVENGVVISRTEKKIGE